MVKMALKEPLKSLITIMQRSRLNHDNNNNRVVRKLLIGAKR